MTTTTAVIATYKEYNMLDRAQTKRAMLTLMAKHNLASVSIEFDGEGDEGSYECPIAQRVGEPEPFSFLGGDLTDVPFGRGKFKGMEFDLYTLIEHLLNDALSDTGWSDNEGAFGDLTVVAEGEEATLTINRREIISHESKEDI